MKDEKKKVLSDYERGFRDGQSNLSTRLFMAFMSAIITYSLTDKKFVKSLTRIMRKMVKKK